MRQQELGRRPALVLLEDAVLDRHLDVVEEDVVDLVLAAQGDDRAHGDARRLHVDQQKADAGLRLGLGVGAHQEEAPVGELRERGPGLLAVDDIVVALAHGAGAQVGEVGAGARLGVALAPPDVAIIGRRQELGLLLGRAERIDHRRDHVDAERQNRDGVGAGLLFRPDVLLRRGPARPAQLLGPARRDPALLGQDLVPGEIVVLAPGVLALALLVQVGGIVVGDEAADLVAEGDVLGGKVEVHGCLLRRLVRPGCWAPLREGAAGVGKDDGRVNALPITILTVLRCRRFPQWRRPA